MLFLLCVLFMGFPATMFGQEPSPIDVELAVPDQVGPGAMLELLIQYKVVDLNAGADLNYNISGPCHVVTREPEPLNPLVNTWKPTQAEAQGTIRIQIQVQEGTDGQKIQHQVEVRWGAKARMYQAETQIKYIPPTPTPTPLPSPTPRPTRAEHVPTPTPTAPSEPTLELVDVSFAGLDGQSLSSAESTQEIMVQATYASSEDLAGVQVTIRFEPDVVNLEGLARTREGFTLELPGPLPAALEGASLFDPPLRGRIRPYIEGGASYALRAIVTVVAPEGVQIRGTGEGQTLSLEVQQNVLMTVKGTVDSRIVKAGGSIIVHATCQNVGATPVDGATLIVAGLPEGFSVNPSAVSISCPAAPGRTTDSTTEERLLTIHAPDGYEGPATFRLIAQFDETAVESEPMTIEMTSSLPLRLEATVPQATVYSGDRLQVNARCANEGKLSASRVTARLVDLRGNLEAVLQEVGDVGPGEARDLVFSIDIPPDLPANLSSLLVVQTLSQDGTLSESEPIAISVVCIPQFQVYIQPFATRYGGGQSAEVVVGISNVSSCLARDVLVSIEGLPQGFAVPPTQKVVELAPGTTQTAAFNVLIPEKYRGEIPVVAKTFDHASHEMRSTPVTLSVGGDSLLMPVLFGVLVVIAVAATVLGTVLYFRYR